MLVSSNATPEAGSRWPLPDFIAGADISLLTIIEQQGVVYEVNGEPVDLLVAMRSNGYNCGRVRLWVNPTGDGVMINDLPYTVALGRRIKQAGLLLMLDIHYSDTWADPGKQDKPAAWAEMTFPQLCGEVYEYTRYVVETMREGGAMPDIVETGNEIIGGMLWPEGQISQQDDGFHRLATLLKNASRGVGNGSGTATKPLIMIHIDRGGDWEGTKWFFDALHAEGVEYDILGESYYPQFHGSLDGLRTALTNAALRYRKPILLTETAYPYKDNGQEPSAYMYPRTPEGQLQFMREVLAIVKSTPNGLGRGVLYWEPEWLPTEDLGSAWNTTALFDDSGDALPAFQVYVK